MVGCRVLRQSMQAFTAAALPENLDQLILYLTGKLIVEPPGSCIVNGALAQVIRSGTFLGRRAISSVMHQYGLTRVNGHAVAAVVPRGVETPAMWRVLVVMHTHYQAVIIQTSSDSDCALH